jgi:hypothetical protein
VSLGNGRDLLTTYQGPDQLQQALRENQAAPRSLASADFDEDGVPDLVSGYAYDGRGIVTVHRGNVDSIYPNAPDAKRRKADGTFTEAPFLSPALAIEVAAAPDFLGAGDFDADGHWDIVLANRGGRSLHLLPGDGKGRFVPEKEIVLDGNVTALTTGDLNRRDGLTDIVVGVDDPNGSQVLVFEGPDGALRSSPETFVLPATVTALAIGQLDQSSEYDLAIATGAELHVIYGRDRKLSLNASQQSAVQPPRQFTRRFVSGVRSLALGDFIGNSGTDIAVLTEDGVVGLLEQFEPSAKTASLSSARQQHWIETIADNGAGKFANDLTRVVVSSSTKDDLLVRDATNRQVRVIESQMARIETTYNSDSSPVAVLPMRLDGDALHDLVILRDGASAPAIAQTSLTPDFVSFSNTSPIAISGSFGTPPVSASPYPSIINVAGVSGPIDKLRVRLNGVSMSSFEEDIDILLVGPAGQQSLIMSDVSTTCVISNQDLTFDDAADLNLESFNCVTGTYKPKDNAPADTFGAPAPAGPYSASLANFNGTNPNGTWSLYMVSDSVFLMGQSIGGGWTLFFGPDSPQNFVVTNTNTSGAGSLAQAILDANAHLGVDNITFNIPGPGPFTINSAPPAINDPVTIDATTQPGFAGKPIIEIHGGFFDLEAGRTTIRGFVLNQTSGDNILIRRAGNNIIEGNFLGTNLAGTAADGSQGGNGVEIDTANNVIGGTTAAARNVIGNKTHGVMFATFDDSPSTTADDASNNLIQGNYIGLTADGLGIIANSHAGVTSRSLPGSPDNTIGGTTAGAGNVIAGGVFPIGVDLVYTGSHGYLIQGNFFGIDATGTKAFSGGSGDGISFEGGTHDNLVGGTTPAARNVISGSIFNGVFLRDSGTSNNLIQGNFIGTDFTGTKSLANGTGLRTIFDANGNTIGGATAAARNILSGNTISGIQFGEPTRGGAVNNIVQGNFIGTDVSGEAPVPNGRTPFFDDAGIIVPANSRGDRIIENRIAYNRGAGIRITNVSGGDINSIEIAIADNLIYANQGLGIDLGGSGITPNDPLDVDDGPNRLQNFPVLVSAVAANQPGVAMREPVRPDPIGVNALTINGTLNSTPNTTFTVHWYFSADAQCVTNQAGSRPLVFGKVPGVTTDGNGNAPFSFPFDLPTGVTGGIINCTATDPVGNTSEFSACLPVGAGAPSPTPTPTPSPAVQLDGSSYSAAESIGSKTVTITRTGNTSVAVTVDYTTSDTAGSNCGQLNTGKASSRCDYETTIGTLKFAAGETSKTISIPIVDDAYGEGSESFTVMLSNASGATLGTPSSAPVNITDNETVNGTNPINDARYYVRVHYLDFLNREPDTSGWDFWTNQITSCGSNGGCIEVLRINVSVSFFLSIEFQQTGYLVERIYKISYGDGDGMSTFPSAHSLKVPIVKLNEFLADTQQIGQGVIVGQGSWQQQLEDNKAAFTLGFVQRSRFTTAFPTTLTPAQFVDQLFVKAGVTPSTADRDAAIGEFGTATNTSDVGARGRALRRVAENATLTANEFNRAFVLMQYFGYLRRNPNDPQDTDFTGYDFWLTKLNQFNGNYINAEMVKAFITSIEYRGRFGP